MIVETKGLSSKGFFGFLGLALNLSIVLVLASAPSAAKAEEDEEDRTDVSTTGIRLEAYKVYGARFYAPDLGYPVPEETFSDYNPPPYRPLSEHAIYLQPGGTANKGADATNWVPIPMHGKAVYYRSEYHFSDLKVIQDGTETSVNDLIDEVESYYRDNERKGAKWSPSEDQKMIMQEQAKIQMVVFRSSDFKMRFYPGKTLLWNRKGSLTTAKLSRPRGGLTWQDGWGRVNDSEKINVAAVFKASYDNIDGIRKKRLPGLVVDGTEVDEPIDYMQTAAIDEQGRLRIGPYDQLKLEGHNVVWLRQNELPLLVKGQIDPQGTYPVKWNRFEDHVVRSYLFMSSDGETFGYAWANYSHPSFVAKLLKSLGFSELMLLDIHPSVGAALAIPSMEVPPLNSKSKLTVTFFDGGAYPFVPVDWNNGAWGIIGNAVLTGWEGRPIQWSPFSAGSGSANDFFAVFLKD